MANPPSTASAPTVAAAAAAVSTTESSSAADSTSEPPSSAAAAAVRHPPPPRQSLSSPHGPPPPQNPVFSGQHLLAKPLAFPSQQSLLYSTATAHHPHRGFPPRSAATASTATAHHRPSDHAAVSVSPVPAYIRASAGPAAVMTFATSQGRPFVYTGDRPVPVHHIRVPQAPPAGQQNQQHAPPSQSSFLVPRPASTLTVPSVSAAPAASGGGVKSVPISAPIKVNALPPVVSAPELKNSKERHRSRDDDLVMINDRKVRVLDGDSCSLYSLCRSWVCNGMPHESQPNFEDGQRILPKPLPMSVVDSQISNEGEINDKANDTPTCSTELSTHDLLEEHIRNAKRVRARLGKERLLRIERYKQRLSLLLPPPSELGRDAAT